MVLRRISVALLSVLDALAWLFALSGVVYLRYDFAFPEGAFLAFLLYGAVVILVTLLSGLLVFTTYRGGFKTGSFDEAVTLVAQFLLAALSGWVAVMLYPAAASFPRLGFFLTPILAVTGALFVRAWFRVRQSRYWPQKETMGNEAHSQAEDILIYGAGYVGGQLVRLTKNDPLSQYRPVGLIDDDPMKRRLRLDGVPVLGSSNQLVELCRLKQVDTVIVGIASLPIDRLNELSDLCVNNRIRLKVIIPAKEISGREYKIRDIEDLKIEQILRRDEISTDLSGITDYIANKVVLITGAGGSIGSELSRQAHKFGPSRLILLDRDESALHSVQLDIYHQGLLNTRDIVLCDIRDKQALQEIFELHRPDVVFHAAALKHLPMLEMYPEEGWKTNVLGSRNVIELCDEYKVDILVNISTDKAADPTSVLGRTKRLAEQMTAAIARGRYVSVRFGNVLGSRGSMLWTFKKQIEAGGPVTVTHPDVDRYFMTIPEACQLVLQAGAIGRSGEAMVLDMGEPVKILDVAKRMIAQYDARIEIVFTGLRPGEKLSEDLIAAHEEDHRPFHPLISHVDVEAIVPGEIHDYYDWAVHGTKDAVIEMMDSSEVVLADRNPCELVEAGE